ncbi:hypothetical protein FOMCTCXJ_CDS_0008 [Pseudomonas phage Athelas]|nr:hypothetical protein FOMCTCXJ_CDS_0008 [Pseudomonas phage Athelas]
MANWESQWVLKGSIGRLNGCLYLPLSVSHPLGLSLGHPLRTLTKATIGAYETAP